MRVSPVGWAFDTLNETLEEAKRSAIVSHDHPEGIKGAQASAAAIYLGRTGSSKAEIKKYISDQFGYNLDRKIDEIRPEYYFNESCQETVPEAIIAFLESNDFEHAIRLAISIGGDSDTIACITGGIAEAYYGEVPENIAQKVLKILPPVFVEIVKSFSLKYRNQ
jgi:ADP-ribosylglycohydrolase